MAQAIYAGRVADAQTAVAQARKDLAAAQDRAGETIVGMAEEAAKRAVDPMERIKKLYDDQVIAAENAARAEFKRGESAEATGLA